MYTIKNSHITTPYYFYSLCSIVQQQLTTSQDFGHIILSLFFATKDSSSLQIPHPALLKLLYTTLQECIPFLTAQQRHNIHISPSPGFNQIDHPHLHRTRTPYSVRMTPLTALLTLLSLLPLLQAHPISLHHRSPSPVRPIPSLSKSKQS